MKPRVLQQFADAVPRIQASEALMMAQAVALGSGALRRHDAKRLRRMLERQAAGRSLRERENVYKPTTREEHEVLMAALGGVNRG